MQTSDEIVKFYQEKFTQHGATAQGMAHRDEATHMSRLIRTAWLSQTVRGESILDIGCGMGMLADILRLHLDINTDEFMPQYTGIDIVPEYIKEAKAKYPEWRHHFLKGDFMDANFTGQYVETSGYDATFLVGTIAWLTHELARAMIQKAWQFTKHHMVFTALTDRPFNKLELINGPIWLSPRPTYVSYHTGYLTKSPVGPGEAIYVFGK